MFRVILSVTGARVAASAIQAITLLALMRSLGAVEFGQFAALSAACGVTVVVLGFGLNTLALRVSALENAKEVATTIALVRFPITLAGCGLTYTGALIIFGMDLSLIFLIGAIFAATESIGEGVESILYGLSRVGRAQLTLLSRRTILLVGVILGVLFDQPYEWLSASGLLILVLLSIPLKGALSKPTPFRQVLVLAVPLWPATVLAKLQTLDVVVAAVVISPAGAGVYAAATRVTSPLNTFAVSALSVLTPSLASRSSVGSKRQIFSRSRRIMFMALGLLVLASPLVGVLTEFLLGPEYEGINVVAAILTCMTGVAALTQIYVSLFYSVGDGMTVAKIRAVTVPVALGVGGVAAVISGPIGLALTMVGLQTSMCLWLSTASKKHKLN